MHVRKLWLAACMHACMMNSLRRLLLSEVTGHKVMTVAVLRIPRFLHGAATAAATLSLTRVSRSRSCFHASLSSSSIALAAAAYCYIPEIAWLSYGFFLLSAFASAFVFHQQSFICNYASLNNGISTLITLKQNYYDYLSLLKMLLNNNGLL